ncbi:MAG: 16S rRNA (guanine(966)-N(2))-methyltransferase RsmD [Deltaproteobacteria bacterium]|nr:16S rRNA (guanine(966)-N(2))-methyltransferase RsmD [Deltaproteobacteria bacterium]
MSIRISGGIYRSRRIECPSRGVRPTLDRVKEAIFSTLQMNIEGAEVLDLFAGSGNLGIEALSRGALCATFVDKARICTKVIEKNLKTLGILEKSGIITADIRSYLKVCNRSFDLIFADPPYNKGLASQLAPHVYKLLNSGGILVLEHSPQELITIQSWKNRSYGDTMITYIQKD